MRLNSVVGGTSWRALVLVPLLAAAVQAAPAHAEAKRAAPVAASTLDVCEAASGKWIYSGVVSLSEQRGFDARDAKVDYLIQNKVTGPDFSNKYRGSSWASAFGDDRDGSHVFAYSITAAPLTLGTIRNAARVQIPDQFSKDAGPVTLESLFPYAASVCSCTPAVGCVRSQGYWGHKKNLVWPGSYDRQALFFASGLTLQQILTSPAGGSGYIILARQYMAAVLNYAAGASAPPSIIKVIDDASTFFSGGTTAASCQPGQCAAQKAWAGILDTYNNGAYPGAPKACKDDDHHDYNDDNDDDKDHEHGHDHDKDHDRDHDRDHD